MPASGLAALVLPGASASQAALGGGALLLGTVAATAPDPLKVLVDGSTTAVSAKAPSGKGSYLGDRVLGTKVGSTFYIIENYTPYADAAGVPYVYTGPAALVDASTDRMVHLVDANVIVGHWYRVTTTGVATQVSATGSPFARIRVGLNAGYTDLPRFPNANNTASYAANLVVGIGQTTYWQATSSEEASFELWARSSAGALRFAVDSVQIAIEDAGF